MRRFIVFFLIINILATNFLWVIVFAGFQVNKEFIVRTSCVNRNRPWLHCNGKCALKKKLLEAEKKERQQENQSRPIDIICNQKFTLEELFTYYFCISNYTELIVAAPFSHYYSIFNPPG